MTVRCVNISLDSALVERIDALRGDVTRSRFVQRLIERDLEKEATEVPTSVDPTSEATLVASREASYYGKA